MNQVIPKERKTGKEMSGPFLPEEIMIKILLCLPAEVLHDVMSLVCRTWRKLIRDPVFTNSHFSQSANFSPLEDFALDCCFEVYSINKDKTTWDFMKRFNRKYLTHGVGLILAAHRCDRSVLYVLNPITNQLLTLPCNPAEYYNFSENFAVGYSLSTSRYKVVRTQYSSKSLYILTVGVDEEWRKIIMEPHIITDLVACNIFSPPQGICGFIYWYNLYERYIVVLDLEEEIFYKVKFCEGIEGMTSVAKLVKSDKILSIAQQIENDWHFWELVDYKNGGEWRKIGSIDLNSKWSKINQITGLQRNFSHPLISVSRDEVLFWCYNSPLVAYNFKSGMLSPSINNPFREKLMFSNSLLKL